MSVLVSILLQLGEHGVPGSILHTPNEPEFIKTRFARFD